MVCIAFNWFFVIIDIPQSIHEKNELCGGDGFFGKKKLAENLVLKLPKMA